MSKALIIDDDENLVFTLRLRLESMGWEVFSAFGGPEGLEQCAAHLPDMIFLDLKMPRMDGFQVLKRLKKDFLEIPVVILTAHGTIEKAVEAIREGAEDFLTKPIEPAKLKEILEKLAQKQKMLEEIRSLRRNLSSLGSFGQLIGRSELMQAIYRLIEKVAPTSASVLINGESGTGKELVARTLHQLSPRKKGPFMAINCSAIPETLLESEIFGHEKGAFTGASERRIGCFELAHRGTLFLDEIAEMALQTQAKLLRILEEHKFRRLAGKEEIEVDVRVIAATNKEIQSAVQEGSLREDLYYRLNVFAIHLPPLRERKEDIPLLAQAFIGHFNQTHQKRIQGIAPEAMSALMGFDWPGNVRELRNTVERSVILAQEDILCREDLPDHLQGLVGPPSSTISFSLGSTVDDVEKELILKTLQYVGGNKTKAAVILGISLKTLHNKLKRY